MEKAETNSGFENITDQLPDYLKMYEIPGQDPITKHSFDRYQADKKQDLDDFIKDSHYSLIYTIKNLPRERKTELIKANLNNANIKAQKVAAEMIYFAPPEDESDLRKIVGEKIKLGLESTSVETQVVAAQMVVLASDDERLILRKLVTEKIKIGLDSGNQENQKMYAEMMEYTPEEDRPALRKIIAEQIRYNLENFNDEKQNITPEMLRYLSNQDKNIFSKIAAEKIKNCLASPEPDEQKLGVSLIQYLKQEERASFIYSGLTNPNVEIRRLAAKMIEYASLSEIGKLVRLGLKSIDPETQTTSLRMIQYAFLDEKYSIIRESLDSPILEIQKLATEMIDCAPYDKKRPLFDLAFKKGLASELIKPPLYRKKDIASETFSRQNFSKSGSETTLLGGELKDKTIIRHITPQAFSAWQKLFENYSLWQRQDFDYVPVESIISYKLNTDGLVDVYTGVLDISLKDWLAKTNMFKDQLNEVRNMIAEVISNLGFDHGHMHDGNFCLRFYRNKKGEPDFTRLPRLYLIDFDLANSPENN